MNHQLNNTIPHLLGETVERRLSLSFQSNKTEITNIPRRPELKMGDYEQGQYQKPNFIKDSLYTNLRVVINDG